MKKYYLFKTGLQVCLAFIFFVLGIQNSFAQEMCTSSSQKDITGTQNGYRYEVYDQDNSGNFVGTGCMTPGSGALFSARWNVTGTTGGDFLARRGMYYGSGTGQTYKNRGGLQFHYTADWEPQYSSGGNSNIGVYGWVHSTGSSSATAEFYIVEDWYQWNQSMDSTAQDLGQISMHGVPYEVYKTTRTNAPSPFGTMTFSQYISVRLDQGTGNQTPSPAGTISGTINVTEHFAAWEKLGLNMSGELYEVSFSAEGYQSSGTVNVSQLDITSVTTPTSIALTPSTYTMNVGDQLLLQWTYNPSDYGNDDVLVVSTNGTTACNYVNLWSYHGQWIMTAMNPGTCTLTIFSPDGLKTGTATVTVNAGTAQARIVQTQALGTKGGEQIFLLRAGNRINQGHVLSTSFQTFTDTVYGEGDISVAFTTDDGVTNGHDVRLDYISVDGVKRETESIAVNPAAFVNGKCGGGGNTEWLNCNGAVDFGPLNDSHTIAVRARGNAGGEHIALLVNGVAVNAGWYLGTSFQTYTVTVRGDGDLNVRYDNDGGLRDVVIDWLQVDNQVPRQAENMQYNTGYFANGRCGGGSYSEWMQCNGVIGFGKISDNFH